MACVFSIVVFFIDHYSAGGVSVKQRLFQFSFCVKFGLTPMQMYDKMTAAYMN